MAARQAIEQIIDLRYTLRMLGVPLDGPGHGHGRRSGRVLGDAGGAFSVDEIFCIANVSFFSRDGNKFFPCHLGCCFSKSETLLQAPLSRCLSTLDYMHDGRKSLALRAIFIIIYRHIKSFSSVQQDWLARLWPVLFVLHSGRTVPPPFSFVANT